MGITTILIIVVCAASLYAWNTPEAFQKMILNPFTVHQRKEYYRFITSGFIHSSYTHLGFNMYAMYIFGKGVEVGFGQLFGDLWMVHFVALFVLGIIVSDIPTFLKFKNLPHYNSLGASGGVSSIVFAFVFMFPTQKLGFILWPEGIPAYLFGGIYLAFSSYQDKKNNDNTNHSAHFWGSIFGIIYLVVLKPQLLLHFIEQVTNW